MKEALDNAWSELKRVDHIFYVSLKYTRTVEMMLHMIERLINTYSFCIESLLKYAKEKKKISEIPSNEGLRAKLASEIFDTGEVKEHMNLYMKLKQILRANYSKREEYRRHVTMTATIGHGEIVEVNIDVLKEYYEQTKAFVEFVRSRVYGEEEF